MAWKLKKWKGPDEDENPVSDQGLELSHDESGADLEQSPSTSNEQIFSAPASSQAFNSAQFSQPDVPAAAKTSPLDESVTAKASPLDVIPMGPPDTEEEASPAATFLSEHDEDLVPLQPTSVHDLDSPAQAPPRAPDLSAEVLRSAPPAAPPDYFAASAAAESHEDVFAPMPAQEPEQGGAGQAPPAKFQFDPLSQQPAAHAPADLSATASPADSVPAFEIEDTTPGPAAPIPAQPVFEEPSADQSVPAFELDDQPIAPPPPVIATPPPAASTPANSLDAFAPYQPAAAPPPQPERFAAADESAGQVFTPVPSGADENGHGAVSQPAEAPGFDEFKAPPNEALSSYEDTLSFASAASSRLIVKIGPFTATYDLNKPEITVGRPDAKTGTSPDIGLEWDDAVSRRHARILHRAEGDYIEDVGSSNGTLLNGQPIAVATPILLKDGDTITIGERTQISYLK